MNTPTPLQRIARLGLILMMGISMGACSDSWKEEVLLHDGGTIVVKRSQSYGGRHEIGQPSPIIEHTISFALPGSNKTIKWTSENDEELGRTSFNLLALHIMNGVPYVVAEPNLCLSYNKWGRPNPPYLFFKYDGKDWQRIQLTELPIEFKTFNVVIYLGSHDVEQMVGKGLISVEEVKKRNSVLKQPEYKSILREPIKPGSYGSGENCEELIRYKGQWVLPNDPVARKMIDRWSK